ncbi:glycerol-3-phosphate dehydrogenase/oxidase [Labrys neptuniae]|uniref:glycerol-3-phosphate dehydrogenase/oxidase n=1 Tax=Labrys neptuniae TaxID=376174 RepID=UPI00288E2828|nr:glycerol-3-phosphate dehydrogenase/oxidase [Labrys neptuniae]MDT3379549.1 glycerol-3-phosphate dehydrogenase/oxidase [Labrys neptuniae]
MTPKPGHGDASWRGSSGGGSSDPAANTTLAGGSEDPPPRVGTSRAERLDRLRAKGRIAVLVVGGGINGISTFRELALQGIDVVLVERGDFMSGASAAPSRMIHGGLRYLENGEFGLVKESLLERNRLLRNAPHYVSALPTLIPLADRFSGTLSAARRFLGGRPKPGPRGALIVRLGLALYDFYARRERQLPQSRFFGRRATRFNWPDFHPDINYAALYHDAKISRPEQLGLELIADAESACPQALALNHLGLARLDGTIAELTDSLTGERITLTAEVIVNASGAWIDQTNALISGRQTVLIGGTKGSHLVLDSPALLEAIGERMVYFANREGRVCILFAHFGHILAGSTDIRVDTPDGVRCEASEAAYILESIREVFPGIALSEVDILFRFAGVRPLPRADANVNAEISRDHSCEWSTPPGPVPVLNLVGGKWTTFRAFGAQAADTVLARLGTDRTRSSEALAIGGGKGFPQGEAERRDWLRQVAISTGTSEERCAALFERYGTRMLDFMPGADDALLASLPSYSRDEVRWILATGQVATLADLVLRRMTIAFSGELSLDTIHELAALAASPLGWSQAQTQAEIDRLLTHLDHHHGLAATTLVARNSSLPAPLLPSPVGGGSTRSVGVG